MPNLRPVIEFAELTKLVGCFAALVQALAFEFRIAGHGCRADNWCYVCTVPYSNTHAHLHGACARVYMCTHTHIYIYILYTYEHLHLCIAQEKHDMDKHTARSNVM